MKQKDIDREYRKFAQEWLPKMAERAICFLECIRNKKKVKEEDWDVIMAYHRLYYLGYCEEFIQPWQAPQKQSKQTTIFDTMTEPTEEQMDKMAVENAENGIGEDFAIELLEPTIVIENDTDKEV